jgi:hypothetical protein
VVQNFYNQTTFRHFFRSSAQLLHSLIHTGSLLDTSILRAFERHCGQRRAFRGSPMAALVATRQSLDVRLDPFLGWECAYCNVHPCGRFLDHCELSKLSSSDLHVSLPVDYGLGSVLMPQTTVVDADHGDTTLAPMMPVTLQVAAAPPSLQVSWCRWQSRPTASSASLADCYIKRRISTADMLDKHPLAPAHHPRVMASRLALAFSTFCSPVHHHVASLQAIGVITESF